MCSTVNKEKAQNYQKVLLCEAIVSTPRSNTIEVLPVRHPLVRLGRTRVSPPREAVISTPLAELGILSRECQQYAFWPNRTKVLLRGYQQYASGRIG